LIHIFLNKIILNAVFFFEHENKLSMLEKG